MYRRNHRAQVEMEQRMPERRTKWDSFTVHPAENGYIVAGLMDECSLLTFSNLLVFPSIDALCAYIKQRVTEDANVK